MTLILSADPSSQIGASLSEWSHPVTREALVFMDLYDLQHMSKSKRRPKPYPRPWSEPARKTWGRTSMTREAVLAILTAHREGGANAE